MSVNQDTSLVLVNTTNNPGTITLPPASQTPGRLITFKDQAGTFAVNNFTLRAQGADTFDDGTTAKIFRESYGSIQVVASGSKWFLVMGTQVNTFAASTINTSTINLVDANTSTVNMFQRSSILYFNNQPIAGVRVAVGQMLVPS